MTGLLYALEDHFDAVASLHEGEVSGRVSRSISSLCAVAGDVLSMFKTGVSRP
jgi:hypothetical protein